MARHDVVVIGGSAGGLQALTSIVSHLPATLPACLLVVIHSSSNGTRVLPQILARSTQLSVAFASTGDPIEPGRIYIAPSDFHLVMAADGLRVVHGPRENGFRPAVDPLFRTAARQLGPRVIGVVLSGALSDGTYGLSVIKHYGGTTIVQDPEDAIISSMPRSALNHVDVDHVLPAREIGGAIEHLTSVVEPREGGRDMSGPNELEPQLRSQATEVSEMQELFGPPSALTCPDCGGALWEIQEGRVVRYQCHVGHQYAPENLDEGQREAIDGALWSAVRVLEEHAALKMRMADRASEGGLTTVSAGFAEGARDAHEQAQRIRAVLFDMGEGDNGVEDTGTQPRAAIQATAVRSKTRARSRTDRSTGRRPRR